MLSLLKIIYISEYTCIQNEMHHEYLNSIAEACLVNWLLLVQFFWFTRVPTPVAVVISASVFALAHLTPGEFPQLFVLGMV